jgi:drug/metabolite transporter (DMT)-like permease
MTNLNEDKTKLKQEQHCISNDKTDEKLILKCDNANNKDYSTLPKSEENSFDYNENTTNFDLWRGLFYMFLSCVFKSLFSILSKSFLKGKSDLSSFQLLTYRTYFMLWLSIVVLSVYPINVFSEEFVKKGKLLNVIARTIFAIISMSLVVFAIKFMHISDVYSVYYIYPGFIIILSLFYLKNEKLSVFDYLCLSACFIGVILIIKPEFIFKQRNNSGSEIYFYLLVIIAALLKSIEDVIVRNTGKDAHYLIFPVIYSVFGMILFPIPMLLFDVKYPTFNFTEVVIVFMIAVCTFLYQAFMALGLQNESASRVSIVNYVQIALMYVCDLALFDKEFNVLDFLATLLIFGFNFINGLYKTMKRMNDLNRFKKNEKNYKIENRS